jgi:serine/threonine protein kinase
MDTGRSDGHPDWSAAAVDVVGPGERRRWGEGATPRGDRGRLEAASGSLFFAGQRGTWVVPLSWLAVPETDLAGVTHLRVRTADRGREIAFRLRGGAEDETGLGDAIRRAHEQEADPRDRTALADLVRLVRAELAQLEAEDDAKSYPARVGDAASRLGSTWMPYWGNAATRFRDATLGMLTATAEASAADADESAASRRERAVRRWQNVCEDLSEWCGVPAEDELPGPPSVRRAQMAAAAPPSPAAAPEEYRPAAAPPPTATAAPQPAAVPEPEPEPQLVAAPPPVEPEAAATEEEDEGTLIIRADQLPSYSQPPVAAPPPPVAPPPAEPAPTGEESESTLIFNRYQSQETAPPAPTPRDYEEATVLSPRESLPPIGSAAPVQPAAPPPQQATPEVTPPQSQLVVSGPGRKGSGGMTMLYRRSGIGSMPSVARKELEPEAAAQPDVERIFLEIGRRFGTVRHPNFVHILGSGKDMQTRSAYIDMEFVEGESIGARQRRGPMPAPQALDIIDQIAAAIDAVHGAGFVHGDVRPQNVLIEPAGRVVLLEPSLAVDHELEHRRGTIYGELPYLTLERVRGEPDVPASDVYALGTMAFALLTGRPPWDGDPAVIFTGHEEEAPPPLDRYLSGAPPQASAAIAAAMAKRPVERPRTAMAFAQALRRALGLEEGSTVTGSAPGRPSGIVAPPASSVGTSLGPQGGRPAEPPQQAKPAMPGPLGRSAPSPLGSRTPPDDEEPPDDIDRTIIVRPK